jgi:uncharacterized membrane protein
MTGTSALDATGSARIVSSPQGRRSPRARSALARLGRGEVLVVAGWIVVLVGIAVYCGACFATDSDADLGVVVMGGTIPVARLGLLVIGAGTLTWIVGSFLHLHRPLPSQEP